MTPFEMLVTGQEGVSLTEANDLIWQHKLNCLPVIDQNGRLRSLVFRKDYEQSKANPRELTDGNKRLMVGAGINTRDYRERVPSARRGRVDIMVVDSSVGSLSGSATRWNL